MHRKIPVTAEVEETVRAYFKLEVTTAIGAGCWIQADLPLPFLSTLEEADSAPVAETVMEKDGAEASAALPQRANPSRRGLKPRPETREKRPHRADSSSKVVVMEPSI